jgi:hypothetical protein
LFCGTYIHCCVCRWIEICSIEEEEQGYIGIQYLIWNFADVFHIIAAAVPVSLSACAIPLPVLYKL